MTDLLSVPAAFWLGLGVFLILFEVLTVPGLGIALAGLGALGASVVTASGLVGGANHPAQCAWWFGLTALFTLLLWRPLQRFRVKSATSSAGYSNLLGTTALVAPGGLTPGAAGQVVWSGTRMSALLSPESLCAIPEGTPVLITAVAGNTLTVIPVSTPVPPAAPL